MSGKATPLQKGCYKLWQRQMAEALNDSGQTLMNAVKTGKLRLDTPWTEFTVQQIFTDNFLARQYPDANSISDLSATEISNLHVDVNHAIAQVFDISIPFPSEHELMLRSKGVTFDE